MLKKLKIKLILINIAIVLASDDKSSAIAKIYLPL